MHKLSLMTPERMANSAFASHNHPSPTPSPGFHTAPATPIPSAPATPDESPSSSSTSTSTYPLIAAPNKDLPSLPAPALATAPVPAPSSPSVSQVFHPPQWSSALFPERSKSSVPVSVPSPLSPKRTIGSPALPSKSLEVSGRKNSNSPKTVPAQVPQQYIKKYGRLHHNYDPQDVPYSWPCDAMECDRQNLFHLTIKSLLQGNIVADLKEVPKRVLDLGTGTGIWILDQALEWKNTEFTGIDVVPLFPNSTAYSHLQSPSSPNRVSFLVHDFLHALPFPDKHFDYVHLRFCGMGIPEHKANDLIEEIVRVTKVGGSIEVIDADIQVHLPTDREVPADVRRVTEELNEWNRTHLVRSKISPYATSVWPPILMINLQGVKRVDFTSPFAGIGTSSYTDTSKTQRNMTANARKGQEASTAAADALAARAQESLAKGVLPNSSIRLTSVGYVVLYNLVLYISGMKSSLWKASGLDEDEFDRRMINYIRECEKGVNGEYMVMSAFYGRRGED